MTYKEWAQQVDIVDFIGQYIYLESSGDKYKGVCVLHMDSDPSLLVYPATNTWYCFGCKRGGDAIKFYMLYNNVSFVEALDALGIDREKKSSNESKYSDSLLLEMLLRRQAALNEVLEQEKLS